MKNNVVFLDCTQSYPLRFSACNSKIEMMARGLMEQGDDVCIINGIVGDKEIVKTEKGISRSGIKYILYPFRYILVPNKLYQFSSWIFNLTILYKDLKENRNVTNKNLLILDDSDYHLFLIYILYARLLGYKIAFCFWEWGVSCESVNIFRKPSFWLIAHTFGFFVDGILPISQFLEEKSSHFNRKSLRCPILADYSFDNYKPLSEDNIKEGYFLYCASAGYLRIIKFIISAFEIFKEFGGNQKLVLVLTGSTKDIMIIQMIIDKKKLTGSILIKTQLPYKELLENYRNAIALLIPLDPNSLQDKARFSQKIAEYISSYRPIITSDVGEIPYYFKDLKSAFIVSNYSPQGYASKMIEIVQNYELANIVGYDGRKVGEDKFNYKKYGFKLHLFIKTL